MARASIGIVLPKTAESPRRPVPADPVAFARRAEEFGYDSLWTTEGWERDSFVELTQIACGTESIGLGTSIVNVYSRTPAVLSMASASLAAVSGGRFKLGLGTGHPGLIEDLHDIPWTRPVRRTRETLDVIKRLTAGSTAGPYHGEIFDVTDKPPFDIDIPVYNAALGPANRRVTGQVADGWLPYNIPLPALDDAFDTIAAAARAAGRRPGDIEVAPWIPAAVSPDPAEATDLLRGNLARYIGDFRDDAYKNAVAQQFPAEADRVASAWRAGNEETARDAVTDEMTSALGVGGAPGTARDRLETLLEGSVIDTAIISIPPGATGRIVEATVEALAPANR